MNLLKIKKGFGIAILVLYLNSCSSLTPVSIQSISEDNLKRIIVLNIDEKIPEKSKILGKIKIRRNLFFTNCEYDTVIKRAKIKAIKMGGDVVKITKNKPIDVYGRRNCHILNVTILKMNSFENYVKNNKNVVTNIATINIYRFRGGDFFNYNLYLNDSLISKVKSNFKKSIIINNEGVYSLKVDKNSIDKIIPVDIKLGKNYYIKCGVKLKISHKEAVCQLMDEKKGKVEFESFIAKNN